MRVSERLASIGEVIPLPPQEVLYEAQDFLAQKGYRLMRRTGTLVTMERARSKGFLGWEKELLDVTVEAEPQPGGGVLVSVSGTDREGVLECRNEWNEWAGQLRAKAEERREAPAAQEPPGGEGDVPVTRDEPAGSSGDEPAGELDLANLYYKPGQAGPVEIGLQLLGPLAFGVGAFPLTLEGIAQGALGLLVNLYAAA